MNERIVLPDEALVELQPVAPIRSIREQTPPDRPFRLFRWLLILIVVLPGCLATAYYLTTAADQYASETRFLVRSPQRQASGLLSGFLQSTGFVRAQDDSFAVSEFIRSRAAVDELDRDGQLTSVFSRPEADLLTQYPQFWVSPSREALYRHYLDFVTVSNDSTSGVTTLQVRAFRPNDSQDLARLLVQKAEALINRLNDRARHDAVRHAETEVSRSSDRLTAAQAQITDFRNREVMIDPDKESTSIFDLIAKLSTDVAEKRARLREIERQTPRSPQISALQGNIAATEEQVRRERERLVGKDSSVAPRIAAFEGLLIERELATRMLASATASLENARLEAQRQQLYLERIVEPNLPDYAMYPKKLYALSLLFAVLLTVYGICRLLLLHLYEHVEP